MYTVCGTICLPLSGLFLVVTFPLYLGISLELSLLSCDVADSNKHTLSEYSSVIGSSWKYIGHIYLWW